MKIAPAKPSLPGRSRRRAVAASAIGALLSGCAASDLTVGSLAPGLATGQSDAAPKADAARPVRTKPGNIADLARAHTEKPKDGRIALAYARGLKAAGKANEAVAVLEAALDGAPNDRQLLVEQGLLTLELGHVAKAQRLLSRASPATSTDWRVHSGLGVAAAGSGQFADAQRHFARALELSPNNPSVLNNSALGYILDGKVEQAEGLLRRAAADGRQSPRIAKNLALAMALKEEPAPAGKAGEGTSEPAAGWQPVAKPGKVAVE